LFDAAGVRRAVGRQATVLNKVMEDLYTRGQVPEKRLKELLGHTPVEVFIGAAFGIVVVWLLRY
jgi:acid phosphatase family membrane protein YuiD